MLVGPSAENRTDRSIRDGCEVMKIPPGHPKEIFFGQVLSKIRIGPIIVRNRKIEGMVLWDAQALWNPGVVDSVNYFFK
jgi:hypothetical protein